MEGHLKVALLSLSYPKYGDPKEALLTGALPVKEVPMVGLLMAKPVMACRKSYSVSMY